MSLPTDFFRQTPSVPVDLADLSAGTAGRARWAAKQRRVLIQNNAAAGTIIYVKPVSASGTYTPTNLSQDRDAIIVRDGQDLVLESLEIEALALYSSVAIYFSGANKNATVVAWGELGDRA